MFWSGIFWPKYLISFTFEICCYLLIVLKSNLIGFTGRKSGPPHHTCRASASLHPRSCGLSPRLKWEQGPDFQQVSPWAPERLFLLRTSMGICVWVKCSACSTLQLHRWLFQLPAFSLHSWQINLALYVQCPLASAWTLGKWVDIHPGDEGIWESTLLKFINKKGF